MALGVIPAGVARAGSQVDAAVQGLRSSPIYSAPGAQLGLSSADRSRVERAIAQEQPGPFYVAVLPDSARSETGGDTNELVREIGTTLRRPGTYVVLAPDASCARGARSWRPARRADLPAMRSTPIAARGPARCSPIWSTGSPTLATE